MRRVVGLVLKARTEDSEGIAFEFVMLIEQERVSGRKNLDTRQVTSCITYPTHPSFHHFTTLEYVQLTTVR